jgi:tetratricopeptide (TPR) repeat protein
MMKTTLTIIVCLASILSGKAVQAQESFDTQMKVYRLALEYYDLQAATVALYNAVTINPAREDLKDSLVYLFFSGERYLQSYKVGEEIIGKYPEKHNIRSLVALSKQALGYTKEALADYEKLYAATKDLSYLYQIATIQYELKRYGECLASLDAIIANEKSGEVKVPLRNQDKTGQDVPMSAAAKNVKGICAMELSQFDAARNWFNEALKIFPEFNLAKNNLAYVDKLEAEAAKNALPAKPAATKSAVAPKGR